MRRRSDWRGVLAALALLVCQASALSAAEITPVLPLIDPRLSPSGFVFEWFAPGTPFAGDATALGNAFAADEPLRLGLHQPGPAAKLTGIDLAQVEAVLVTGSPPSTLSVLLGREGPDGFVAAADPALTARGFAAKGESGFMVYARGDDNAIDMAMRTKEPDDPFGGGIGRAQRIAIGGGQAIIASDWAALRAAFGRLRNQTDCTVCDLYRGMIKAAGGDAAGRRVTRALGLTAAAFTSDDALLQLLAPDPAGAPPDLAAIAQKLREKLAAGGKLPPFTLALLALSKDQNGEAAHIVLLFPDDASAAAGAAEVVRRYPEFLAERAGSAPLPIGSYVLPLSLGTAAIVTLTDPSDRAGASAAEFNAWLTATIRRQMSPLSLMP